MFQFPFWYLSSVFCGPLRKRRFWGLRGLILIDFHVFWKLGRLGCLSYLSYLSSLFCGHIMKPRFQVLGWLPGLTFNDFYRFGTWRLWRLWKGLNVSVILLILFWYLSSLFGGSNRNPWLWGLGRLPGLLFMDFHILSWIYINFNYCSLVFINFRGF